MITNQPVCAQYVFDREDLVLREEDAPFIDQLNYSFALVRDGRITGDHWGSIGAYKAFIVRHPHILPVVSVGGWGADGFSQAAATARGRALFVQSTLDLMTRHGFLGVDIDWEYPCRNDAGIAASPQDKANFTLLLRALREGLDALSARDGRKRLLAAAFGAHERLVGDIECGQVGALLDQINLMTYDLQTAGTLSHLAPLYKGHPDYPNSADTALRAFTAAGMPKDKIMLGNAFYARLFTAKDAAVPFSPALDGGAKTLRYRELAAQTGWTHAFDDTACAAYAVCGSVFATYDSPRSIACKGAYVRKHGLMGLMCWEYGGDSEGTLTRAMRESLTR